MKAADYIVLTGILIAAVAAVAWTIHRKKQGRSGCGNCPYQAGCDQLCGNRKRNFL